MPNKPSEGKKPQGNRLAPREQTTTPISPTSAKAIPISRLDANTGALVLSFLPPEELVLTMTLINKRFKEILGGAVWIEQLRAALGTPQLPGSSPAIDDLRALVFKHRSFKLRSNLLLAEPLQNYWANTSPALKLALLLDDKPYFHEILEKEEGEGKLFSNDDLAELAVIAAALGAHTIVRYLTIEKQLPISIEMATYAALSGDVALFRDLAEKPGTSININSSLIFAAKANSTEIYDYILGKYQVSSSQASLNTAIGAGHHQFVAYLLDKGLRPTPMSLERAEGQSNRNITRLLENSLFSHRSTPPSPTEEKPYLPFLGKHSGSG